MRITVSVLLVFLGACGPSVQAGGSGSDVRLVIEPDAVAPGDTVLLTLTNGSPYAIGYNLCSSGVEVREGDGWSAVTSSRVCTMELRTLEPDATASYHFDLPAGLAPGAYRFTTTVERLQAGDRVGIRSAPFTVGSGGI